MVHTIYVSQVCLKVDELYFPPFHRTDKFWYMPLTYDTKTLLYDNKKQLSSSLGYAFRRQKGTGRKSGEFET